MQKWGRAGGREVNYWQKEGPAIAIVDLLYHRWTVMDEKGNLGTERTQLYTRFGVWKFAFFKLGIWGGRGVVWIIVVESTTLVMSTHLVDWGGFGGLFLTFLTIDWSYIKITWTDTRYLSSERVSITWVRTGTVGSCGLKHWASWALLL